MHVSINCALAMKINRIKIRNFRGFKEEEIIFPTNMTVVIGNNTAGKTTLLGALQVGIGAYLQSMRSLPPGRAYKRQFSETDCYMRFDPVKRDYFKERENTRIDLEADFFDTIVDDNGHFVLNPIPKKIKWYREMTAKGSTLFNKECAGELMNQVEKLEKGRESHDANAILPIVLFFGTNRIDNQYRTAKKVKERLTRIDKAYKAALNDDVDFAGAMDWMKRYEKNIKDGREFEGTREAFLEALGNAIPAMQEIELDHGELEALVSVTGRQPERHHYSYMSDGFKAVINIVSEIAYRCIQLNGFLKENAVKMTPGIVMIDEVDLYLHPHWQRHILDDLQQAFPRIQFVVTTHSPFIVQSLKKGQLVSFDENVNENGEPYKESLEDIAGTRMGLDVEIRSQRFNEMVHAADEFFEALDSGNSDANELKQKLDLIEAEFSEDPAYVAFIKSQYHSKNKA